MRRTLRSLALPVLALSLLAAACGGDDPTPTTTTTAPTTPAPTTPTTAETTSPPASVAFTTGSAHLEVTGDENATIDFSQLTGDRVNGYDPEDGNAEIDFVGGDDGLLRMTLTFDESGQLTDAFIAIGLGGQLAGDENYYYDAFHGLCDVSATFDGTAVSGDLTCQDLPEEDGDTIDATGTFEASA